MKARQKENGEMDVDTAPSTTGINPVPTNPELDAVTKESRPALLSRLDHVIKLRRDGDIPGDVSNSTGKTEGGGHCTLDVGVDDEGGHVGVAPSVRIQRYLVSSVKPGRKSVSVGY